MSEFLKQYRVTIQTIGPVFIGNGKEIGKKEYAFLGQDKVVIPDMQKFYYYVQKKGKAEAFEDYLLSGSRDDLSNWLRRQGIRSSELKPLVRYELDCGDAVMEKGRTIQMMECIKDPYGNPYIPGTSLKGMFRTIFLCEDMIKNPDKYRQEKNSMEREVMSNDMRVNRMAFLKRQVGDVEAKRYRTLGKNEKKPNDAVNDQLQGFVVSDSEPLSVRDLVLCQKVDRHPDGTEKTLPILRECIKPGTEIRFTITIDTSVCDLDDQKIKAAVKAAIQNYYSNFQKAFTGFDLPKVSYVYLGGGSGFVSKTMIYAMYGKQRGIELTQRIFDKTKVPRNHKHYKDKEYCASPHILKCTRYQGRTLQMGLCRIAKIELCGA
jgi:CRISPR-associated protein Csm5